jgi:hypothetical protein
MCQLNLIHFAGKSKSNPITGHERPRGVAEVYLYSLSTSALGGSGWSAPRPGRFTPGKDPLRIVQEAGYIVQVLDTKHDEEAEPASVIRQN